MYLAAIQLALSRWPSGVAPSLVGLIVGYALDHRRRAPPRASASRGGGSNTSTGSASPTPLRWVDDWTPPVFVRRFIRATVGRALEGAAARSDSEEASSGTRDPSSSGSGSGSSSSRRKRPIVRVRAAANGGGGGGGAGGGIGGDGRRRLGRLARRWRFRRGRWTRWRRWGSGRRRRGGRSRRGAGTSRGRRIFCSASERRKNGRRRWMLRGAEDSFGFVERERRGRGERIGGGRGRGSASRLHPQRLVVLVASED